MKKATIAQIIAANPHAIFCDANHNYTLFTIEGFTTRSTGNCNEIDVVITRRVLAAGSEHSSEFTIAENLVTRTLTQVGSCRYENMEQLVDVRNAENAVREIRKANEARQFDELTEATASVAAEMGHINNARVTNTAGKVTITLTAAEAQQFAAFLANSLTK
jgi:hypothetical protein